MPSPKYSSKAGINTPDRSRRVARLRSLSRLLDSSVRLPIIGYRVGLDPIIGLIPGFGDAVTLLPAGYIILEAYRLGVPRRTVTRMALNVGIETLFGSVPVLGDIFDAAFKANTRNLYLLERHLGPLGDKPLQRPSNKGVTAFLGLALLLSLLGVGLALWLGLWLFRRLVAAL